jgi:hypothetical protein
MTVKKIRLRFNPDPLPLFAWAAERERRHRMSYPVAWLRKRHPLSADRANLLAELAGLGGAE